MDKPLKKNLHDFPTLVVTNHLQIIYQSYTNRIPIVYQSYTNRIPIVYQSYTNRIPIVYLSYTYRIPPQYQPYTIVYHHSTSRIPSYTTTVPAVYHRIPPYTNRIPIVYQSYTNCIPTVYHLYKSNPIPLLLREDEEIEERSNPEMPQDEVKKD